MAAGKDTVLAALWLDAASACLYDFTTAGGSEHLEWELFYRISSHLAGGGPGVYYAGGCHLGAVHPVGGGNFIAVPLSAKGEKRGGSGANSLRQEARLRPASLAGDIGNR